MSNAIETAMFLRRYQSWRKGEIDVFYPDSHAGPNPVEISAAIDRAIVALEAQPPCGADGAVPESFVEYMRKNYPEGTVIADGAWHARPTWNAARHAMAASQPAAPVAPATVADCSACTNRGKVYGLSQESNCEHCIYGEPWRKDLFAASQREGGA